MGKIISLDDKLKMIERGRASAKHKRKIIAVRQIFQCSHCASKCDRCGTILGMDNYTQKANTRIPYHFCNGCAEEYIDYIDKLQGKGDPGAYWHNHAWMKAWRAWIDYRGAMDQYMRSNEFRRLIEELRPGEDNDT